MLPSDETLAAEVLQGEAFEFRDRVLVPGSIDTQMADNRRGGNVDQVVFEAVTKVKQIRDCFGIFEDEAGELFLRFLWSL